MSSTFAGDRWVAIVDDDESIRRALARLLRAHGIETKAFHSARDYLNRAPGTPACICLDLYLRDEMNGFELTELLRARGMLPPIIFITAQDEPELGPVINDRERSTILRKPLDAKLLLDVVMRYASRTVSTGAA